MEAMESTATMSEADPSRSAVVATGMGLTGDEGPVFGPLDFSIPARGLTTLTGRAGSGRTALALVLSGRMKPTEGSLSVLGMSDPKQIRKTVAIAGVNQLDELDRSVTVRDIVSENMAWSSHWFNRTPRATDEDLERYCRPVYGNRSLPPLDNYISQISSLDRLLLRIALSLQPVHKHEINMLVMDNLDQVAEQHDREHLLGILFHIAQSMPVVINTANPLPEGSPPHHSIELATNTSHVQPEHRDPGAMPAHASHSAHTPAHHHRKDS